MDLDQEEISEHKLVILKQERTTAIAEITELDHAPRISAQYAMNICIASAFIPTIIFVVNLRKPPRENVKEARIPINEKKNLTKQQEGSMLNVEKLEI